MLTRQAESGDADGVAEVERFRLEARTVAKLDHPHVIPVYAVRATSELQYFVMKFIRGRSLEGVLESYGCLPFSLVQRIIQQAGSALAHAHKNGVVHRDVKPANIMLDEAGWTVVADFGIAKSANATKLTATGLLLGTVAYMSPEQWEGKGVTGLSDQYSLGCVAYQLLTGKQPFSGETITAMLWSHLNEIPSPITELRPECPVAFERIVMRMLEKVPNARFPTTDEAVAAIGTLSLTQAAEDTQTQLVSIAAATGDALTVRVAVDGVREVETEERFVSNRIVRYVKEAQSLASAHPESALSMARKAAEAICREIHERSHGVPGPRATLDDLIQTLTAHSTIPRRIQLPLRTIQNYTDESALEHSEQASLDGRYILPALQALQTIVQWYREGSRDVGTVPTSSSRLEGPLQEAASVMPLSGFTGTSSTIPPDEPTEPDSIVGREAELGLIRDTIDAVAAPAARTGRVILLSGAGGSGKTVVAEEALRYARSRGLRVVRATCEPFHEGMSFFPVRELTRQLTSAQGLAVDIGHAFGSGSTQLTIARLSESAESDPSARRDAVIATFANQVFARVVLDKSPLILFVDDLERIDTGSVDALMCLIARLRESPVVLLGAYRSDTVGASTAAVHPLRPVVNVTRRADKMGCIVELDSFAEGEMTRLVEALLRGRSELPAPFMRRLFEETEGNPLYVREALRTLSEERSGADAAPLRLVDGVWKLLRHADRWELPRSVEDAIASRLVSLSEADRAILELAAVIGRRFLFEVLLQLGDTTEDILIEALERYLKLELVREQRGADNVFAFTHVKIRDVLYNGMTGLRRARVHGQVADVLQRHRQEFREDEWDVLIGAHLFAARRYSASAPHLLRAGERALELQASAEAAHHLRRALEAFEKSADVPRETLDLTRLLLATALKAANELVAAEAQFLMILRDGVDGHAKAWSLNHLGDISLSHGRVNEALERFTQCEEMARACEDTELLAEVAADLAELHMRQSEHLAGLDAARAREHGALYNRFLDLEQELAHKVGKRHALARAYRNSAKRARARGDVQIAIALYEQSLEYVDAGVDSHRFLIPYAKALRLVGRLPDALEIVRRVLDWSRQIGARKSEAIGRQYSGLLMMEQALLTQSPDLSAARDELKRALALHQEVGFEQGRRETEIDLAELAAHVGDVNESLAQLRLAVNDGSAIGNSDLAHAALAELRANGEQKRAERFERALASLGILESAVDEHPSGP